jgi:hypothetical protein
MYIIAKDYSSLLRYCNYAMHTQLHQLTGAVVEVDMQTIISWMYILQDNLILSSWMKILQDNLIHVEHTPLNPYCFL